MNFYTTTLIIIAGAIVLIACGDKNKSSREKKPQPVNVASSGINFDRKDLTKPQGYELEAISIDTSARASETSGIHLDMIVRIDESLLRQLQSKGFEGAVINCRVESEGQILYNSREDLLANAGKNRVHINKNAFFSHPGKRKFTIHLPYRKLLIPEGTRKVDMMIELHGIRYQKDSAGAEYRIVDFIEAQSAANTQLSVTIQAPELIKATIIASPFAINTDVVNPSKFDFAMGGSGYPDLYWKIFSGSDVIFYAPHKKNKIEYGEESTSVEFICTRKDILKISVADYDNGPFNTDDIIESWFGTIDQIGTELTPVNMKQVKDFRIRKTIVK